MCNMAGRSPLLGASPDDELCLGGESGARLEGGQLLLNLIPGGFLLGLWQAGEHLLQSAEGLAFETDALGPFE